MAEIVSDITYIDKLNPIDNKVIERILTEKFGEIIRWAIIEVTEDKLKICLSYINNRSVQ